jgi:hypothetical protein
MSIKQTADHIEEASSFISTFYFAIAFVSNQADRGPTADRESQPNCIPYILT